MRNLPRLQSQSFTTLIILIPPADQMPNITLDINLSHFNLKTPVKTCSAISVHAYQHCPVIAAYFPIAKKLKLGAKTT